MTAPAYDPLTNDDTGADKILTTGTVQALDTNPVSIAQRGANAPIVQPPVREYKTSGTSATWPIPDGVTAFNIYVIGGGGGTGGVPANSTVTYNSITYTGAAGSAAVGNVGGAGGTATNGDLNLTGQKGGAGYPLGGNFGNGGIPAMFGGYSYGNGASGAGGLDAGGGAGGLCVKRIAVVAGQATATYTVGAGGTGAGGGLVVFEY